MSTPTDPSMIFDARENTAKLPKWATELIYDLRKALGDWKAYAEAARQDTGPESPIVLDYYSSTPIGIGDRGPIYFCDPEQRDHKQRPTALVEARWIPETNVLNVASLSGEPIIAVPVAANVIKCAAMPADIRRRFW